MFNPIKFLVFILLLSGCDASSSTSAPIDGDAERGAQLFAEGQDAAPPCSSCHHIAAGQFGFSIGPNLADIGERAVTQVEGLEAEAYLRQSILEPGHHIVSGYRDIMYPDYAKHFTRKDVQDLIAYLLTL